MRKLPATTKRVFITSLAAVISLWSLVSTAPAAVARPAQFQRSILDLPISFAVQNLDRTALGSAETQTCPADPSQEGAVWSISGHLVAPVAPLRPEPRAVTLYVHGLASGGDIPFRFDGAPGYDYAAEQARAGHASVVIDRIGYGASTHPDGFDVCTGAGADVLHQVVSHLRAGDYGGPRFERVALAGYSAGGLLAEVEAYTFHDVDALAVFSYEDQGFTPFLLSELGKHASRCGQPGAAGYQSTFDDRDEPVTPADNTRAALLSPYADPRVITGVTARHESDPCGENPTPYIVSNPAQLSTVTAPVLLVYGADDALFDAALANIQASHFASADKTVVVLPATAHLLMLERTAPAFRAVVGRWLTQHAL